MPVTSNEKSCQGILRKAENLGQREIDKSAEHSQISKLQLKSNTPNAK
jgi:hypothetical protein